MGANAAAWEADPPMAGGSAQSRRSGPWREFEVLSAVRTLESAQTGHRTRAMHGAPLPAGHRRARQVTEVMPVPG
jgi:hypothetical protein